MLKTCRYTRILQKVSRKVRIPREVRLALHLALRCGFYWLTGQLLTFELWWLDIPDLQKRFFCLHANVHIAPGHSCKVKLWNSPMFLILLKTIERTSFYYCLVSFTLLYCDCVTGCTNKNARCSRTAGRIKDSLNGSDIMNCKVYIQ